MKIGTVTTTNTTVFAPLAGITNLPMRLIAKQAGCGLVCSEMISSNGLVHGSGKTIQLLDSTPDEKPLSVQIFGSDPLIMADAAAMVQASGADILDINFGCSVKKILKSGSGSALMKDPDKTRALLKAVRKAISIPLTIKIRTGWERSGSQALTIAKIAEDCGTDAVIVHPRTATQGFRGKADWDIIKMVKERLTIPVIGNGDITEAKDALAMRTRTGCDGIMVGRAAISNPMIFSQILALERGDTAPETGFDKRIDMMLCYLDASIKYLGEETACYMMRSRLCWFVKGMRNASRFRKSIRFISSGKEAEKIIDAYRQSVLQEQIARTITD